MSLFTRTLPWFLIALALPSYASDDWGDDAWGDEDEQEIQLHGFVELGAGWRTSDDRVLADDDMTLGELRGRIESETYLGDTRYSGKFDLYADGVDGGLQMNLREALADFSLTDNLDLRLGHQVLTWGTGDLVFLNDLFAKDWQSFFSGRDDEYLKAPSTSLKLAWYGEQANLDLVWTPVFANDSYIEGERFSYFSPMSGSQVAAPAGKVTPDHPDETFENGEFALRLHGTAQLFGQSSTEWAVYGYRGFWKQPNAVSVQGRAYFSRLNSLGASLRTNIASGIGHSEIAWYNGADDAGSDPLLPNNQLRFLLGYEQELLPKLTMGLQYYSERTLDYQALAANDGNSLYRPDENRELWTMRLTYSAMQDNLILSWFSFYSPTDQDYYHRPSAKYRFNDELSLTVGGNIFGGEQAHTFFGQFEDASNLYARLRWSY
ncbi:DUF1302 family protein [Neptuniibacter caesariensis]|uniref:Uncharacterized conserved secreted protein n=1 Tax=Neptuniibacter caesariensis TaxID=207954 RepID=A0A7U8C8T5_NEPCE|nr:DUF1302 family protein [Neptuniibacter caesariensis]EAR61986.1 Uncharacterized conserved secreted protein [Oceanospirillum sp. MED92] [Neptuniibacter caesariensis]